MKHYLQVTDEHFAKAVQNPVQQVSASARKDSQAGYAEEPEPAICGTLRHDAVQCTHREVEMVCDTGLEPKHVTTCGDKDSQNPSPEGGAESGAVSPISGPIDPDLQRVIDAWPNLPEAAKAGIIAMVKASGQGKT